MSVAAAVRRVEKKVPNLLKDLGFNIEKSFSKALENQFRENDGSVFNEGKKLRKGTGELIASFETDTTVSKVKAEFNISTDSKYGAIHEKGGFIRSKGKMHKYFWAKYYESSGAKREMFKRIALSVLKKGGVKIPKRPFFAPALTEFEKEKEKLFQEFIDVLIFEYEFEGSV